MQPMPKTIPPYVQVQRARGRVVFYFRKGHGRRTRLPDLNDPGFDEAYAACLTGAPKPKATGSKKGTLRWLVEQWKQTSDWMQTSVATRKQRENLLNGSERKPGPLLLAGHEPFDMIDATDIMAGREARMATPFAANNYLKTMRALFRWAKEAGHVTVDPAADVKFLKAETEGFTPWTEADVARYRNYWPLGTRQRLAFEVLYNTGLRRGDAVRLGRQHVRDGVAELKSEKTRVTLYVPILPDLADAITLGPIGDMAYISTVSGRPMTKETFGNYFREWCKAAGVNASAHGLRKLSASTLAEKGGSEKELQARFGWKTNTQSALYTKAAEERHLAIQAAQKLNRKRPHTDATAPSHVEIIDKKDGRGGR